jgi:hypothetical protein
MMIKHLHYFTNSGGRPHNYQYYSVCYWKTDGITFN